MILEDSLVDSLKDLPDDCFSIKEGECCKYFSECPFATIDCVGAEGNIDGFTCNTKKLKRIFLKNVTKSSDIQKFKGISGNTATSRS